MDAIRDIQRKLTDASFEMRSLKRKFEDEKNQLIAEAVENGDYYLLAKRIVKDIGSSDDFYVLKFSKFQGLSIDNVDRVIEVVSSMLPSKRLVEVPEMKNVSACVMDPEYGAEDFLWRMPNFKFDGAGKTFDLTFSDLWYVFADMITPNREYHDWPRQGQAYVFEADSVVPRSTNHVVFALFEAQCEEPRSKKKKPLQA